MDSAEHASAPAGIINPLEERLGYQLRRASTVMQADLTKALSGLSLRPHEASALLLIEKNPGITQSEIGRSLGIKRANMAPIAAMLSNRHLVERSRFDGRSQGLRLSPEGEALAHTVHKRMNVHEARFLPGLSPSERVALTSAIAKVWADED